MPPVKKSTVPEKSQKQREPSYDGSLMLGVLIGMILCYINLSQFFIGLFVGIGLAKNNITINISGITKWLSPTILRMQSLITLIGMTKDKIL